jgi:hypothetical protein
LNTDPPAKATTSKEDPQEDPSKKQDERKKKEAARFLGQNCSISVRLSPLHHIHAVKTMNKEKK